MKSFTRREVLSSMGLAAGAGLLACRDVAVRAAEDGGSDSVVIPIVDRRTWPCVRNWSTTQTARLDGIAKALGHPLRVKIVRLLANRTNCVCGELVDELPVAQSTVSQHLKILKEAGLIQGTIDRPRVCYCLAPGALQRLKALVNSLPEACPDHETKSDGGRICR